MQRDNWQQGNGGGRYNDPYGDAGRGGGGGGGGGGGFGMGQQDQMMMNPQQQQQLMQAFMAPAQTQQAVPQMMNGGPLAGWQMPDMGGGMNGGQNQMGMMGMDQMAAWASGGMNMGNGGMQNMGGGMGNMGNMQQMAQMGMGNMGNMGNMGWGNGNGGWSGQQDNKNNNRNNHNNNFNNNNNNNNNRGGQGQGNRTGDRFGKQGGEWNRGNSAVSRPGEKKWPEKKVGPPRDILDGFNGEGPQCIMVLNEYGQQKTCTVTYNTETVTEGDSDRPVVLVTVEVKNEAGKVVSKGSSKCFTKKAAKQRAAAQGLMVLYPKIEGLLNTKGMLGPEPEEAHEVEKIDVATIGETRKRKLAAEGDGLTALDQATDALKQHCSEKGSALELKQTQEGPKHATVFKVLVMVDGKQVASGEGGKKRQALINAVTAAGTALGVVVPDNLEETYEHPLLAAQAAGPRTKVEVTLNNSTTALRAYCTQSDRQVDWKFEEQGLPHSRTFKVLALVSEPGSALPLNEKGNGEAPKKKVAQNKASLAACEAMGVTFIVTGRDDPEEDAVKE